DGDVADVVVLPAEVVAYGDDAVDVLGQADGHGGAAALGQGAGQGDHAFVDGDVQVVGVGAEDQPYLPLDVLVRAQEDLDQVVAADDADQPAALVDHGQALDAVAVHQPRRGDDRRVGGGDAGGTGHQLAGGLAERLAVAAASGPGAVADAGPQRRPVVVAVVALLELLLGQQVVLGDDAHHAVVVVHDRRPADAAADQQLGHGVEGGVAVDGGDVGGHHVLDEGGHGVLLCCVEGLSHGGHRASHAESSRSQVSLSTTS